MSLMAVEVCIYAKDVCGGLYICQGRLQRSVYGYHCRVQYIPLMTVEVCIWHLWLWRSVYGIYGC